MPQAADTALYRMLLKIGGRIKANPELGLDDLRYMLEELGSLTAEPTDVTYAEVEAGGVPSILAKPLKAAADRVILYTHGGGCVTNSAQSHRKLAAHLAKATGAYALVIDYKLAPEHQFPSQIGEAVAAHRWLRKQGFSPAHTATAGDSAGGNLAITSVLKLRDLGEPLPAAVVAISPWIDMENRGDFESNAATDALVNRDLSETMTKTYLGAASPADPLANPLRAELAGFPPVFVSVGDAEVLMDHGERFVSRARAAGVDATLEYGAGQQHIFQIMAGRNADADRSIAAMGAWLRPRLGL